MLFTCKSCGAELTMYPDTLPNPAHAEKCPNNPLAAEIARLQAELDAARGERDGLVTRLDAAREDEAAAARRALAAEARLAEVVEVFRELSVRVQNYGPSPVMPEGEALYEALTSAARLLRRLDEP